MLERNGYAPMAYFVLPEHCWLNAYNGPMQQRLPAFLARHGSSDAAKAVVAVVAVEELEIALYERYRAFVGYGYYVARKTEGAS